MKRELPEHFWDELRAGMIVEAELGGHIITLYNPCTPGFEPQVMIACYGSIHKYPPTGFRSLRPTTLLEITWVFSAFQRGLNGI